MKPELLITYLVHHLSDICPSCFGRSRYSEQTRRSSSYGSFTSRSTLRESVELNYSMMTVQSSAKVLHFVEQPVPFSLVLASLVVSIVVFSSPAILGFGIWRRSRGVEGRIGGRRERVPV